jgi:hypothetical protein
MGFPSIYNMEEKNAILTVFDSSLAGNIKSDIRNTLNFSLPTSTDTPPHIPTANKNDLTPITGIPCYCRMGSCPFHNNKQDLFALTQAQDSNKHSHTVSTSTITSSAPSILQLYLRLGGTSVVTPALPSISTNPTLTPTKHYALPTILSEHLPPPLPPLQHHHHKPAPLHPSTSYALNTTSKTLTISSSTRLLPPS